MAITEEQWIIRMNKHVEEKRMRKEEQKQAYDALRFANMEAFISEAPFSQIRHRVSNPYSSSTPMITEEAPRPPDPPDFNRSRQISITTDALEIAKVLTVPIEKLPREYSCEEVYARMTNGLCLFCEEQDTPGHHQSKHKGIQIFLTECDDDQLSDDTEFDVIADESVDQPPTFECDSVLQVFVALDRKEPTVKGIVDDDKMSLKQAASILEKETIPSNTHSDGTEMKNSDMFYAVQGAETTSAPLLLNGVVTHEAQPQQSPSVNDNKMARQSFDQMSLRATCKKKQRKCLKAWRFKFKHKNLIGIMPQLGQYRLMERKSRTYNSSFSNIQVEPMRIGVTWQHWRMGKRQQPPPFQLSADSRSYIDVVPPISLRNKAGEKQHMGLSRSERVWEPGGLVCIQDQWDWLSEVQSPNIIMKISQRFYGTNLSYLMRFSPPLTYSQNWKRKFGLEEWICGLEIYDCKYTKQMLLLVKQACHVWHRWKNTNKILHAISVLMTRHLVIKMFFLDVKTFKHTNVEDVVQLTEHLLRREVKTSCYWAELRIDTQKYEACSVKQFELQLILEERYALQIHVQTHLLQNKLELSWTCNSMCGWLICAKGKRKLRSVEAGAKKRKNNFSRNGKIIILAMTMKEYVAGKDDGWICELEFDQVDSRDDEEFVGLIGGTRLFTFLVKDYGDGEGIPVFLRPNDSDILKGQSVDEIISPPPSDYTPHLQAGFAIFKNSFAESRAYEVFHLQRPPEILSDKGTQRKGSVLLLELSISVYQDFFTKYSELSSLRTRMLSTREYCYRNYALFIYIGLAISLGLVFQLCKPNRFDLLHV